MRILPYVIAPVDSWYAQGQWDAIYAFSPMTQCTGPICWKAYLRGYADMTANKVLKALGYLQ